MSGFVVLVEIMTAEDSQIEFKYCNQDTVSLLQVFESFYLML